MSFCGQHFFAAHRFSRTCLALFASLTTQAGAEYRSHFADSPLPPHKIGSNILDRDSKSLGYKNQNKKPGARAEAQSLKVVTGGIGAKDFFNWAFQREKSWARESFAYLGQTAGAAISGKISTPAAAPSHGLQSLGNYIKLSMRVLGSSDPKDTFSQSELLYWTQQIGNKKYGESFQRNFDVSLRNVRTIFGKDTVRISSLLETRIRNAYNRTMIRKSGHVEYFSSNARLQFSANLMNDLAKASFAIVAKNQADQFAKLTGKSKSHLDEIALENISQEILNGRSGNFTVLNENGQRVSVRGVRPESLRFPFYNGAKAPHMGSMNECLDRALSSQAIILCASQARLYLQGTIAELVFKNLNPGIQVHKIASDESVLKNIDLTPHLRAAANEVYGFYDTGGKWIAPTYQPGARVADSNVDKIHAVTLGAIDQNGHRFLGVAQRLVDDIWTQAIAPHKALALKNQNALAMQRINILDDAKDHIKNTILDDLRTQSESLVKISTSPTIESWLEKMLHKNRNGESTWSNMIMTSTRKGAESSLKPLAAITKSYFDQIAQASGLPHASISERMFAQLFEQITQGKSGDIWVKGDDGKQVLIKGVYGTSLKFPLNDTPNAQPVSLKECMDLAKTPSALLDCGIRARNHIQPAVMEIAIKNIEFGSKSLPQGESNDWNEALKDAANDYYGYFDHDTQTQVPSVFLKSTAQQQDQAHALTTILLGDDQKGGKHFDGLIERMTDKIWSRLFSNYHETALESGNVQHLERWQTLSDSRDLIKKGVLKEFKLELNKIKAAANPKTLDQSIMEFIKWPRIENAVLNSVKKGLTEQSHHLKRLHVSMILNPYQIQSYDKYTMDPKSVTAEARARFDEIERNAETLLNKHLLPQTGESLANYTKRIKRTDLPAKYIKDVIVPLTAEIKSYLPCHGDNRLNKFRTLNQSLGSPFAGEIEGLLTTLEIACQAQTPSCRQTALAAISNLSKSLETYTYSQYGKTSESNHLNNLILHYLDEYPINQASSNGDPNLMECVALGSVERFVRKPGTLNHPVFENVGLKKPLDVIFDEANILKALRDSQKTHPASDIFVYHLRKSFSEKPTDGTRPQFREHLLEYTKNSVMLAIATNSINQPYLDFAATSGTLRVGTWLTDDVGAGFTIEQIQILRENYPQCISIIGENLIGSLGIFAGLTASEKLRGTFEKIQDQAKVEPPDKKMLNFYFNDHYAAAIRYFHLLRGASEKRIDWSKKEAQWVSDALKGSIGLQEITNLQTSKTQGTEVKVTGTIGNVPFLSPSIKTARAHLRELWEHYLAQIKPAGRRTRVTNLKDTKSFSEIVKKDQECQSLKHPKNYISEAPTGLRSAGIKTH